MQLHGINSVKEKCFNLFYKLIHCVKTILTANFISEVCMKKIGTTIVIALMSVALLTACKSKADEEERFVSSGNYIAKIYLEEID